MKPLPFFKPVFYRSGLALLLLGGALSNASAQGVLDAISQEVNTIFEKAAPSVIRVRTSEAGRDLVGTGFFIDAKGTILTVERIIRDAKEIKVEYKGQLLEARVLGKDARSGLAMLQITTGVTPFLKLGNSAALKTGIFVVAIGFPFNMPMAPTFGPVAGFDAVVATTNGPRFFSTTHIRANAPIVPGQVGGPLLNTKGEVMGVMVHAVDDAKAVYALPSPAVLRVLEDFRSFGSVKHGWVGVGFTELALSEDEQHRVKISQLFAETPASASGLQTGDVVLKSGGRDILLPSDAMDAAFFSKVGQTLPVQVQRGNKVLTFKFTVSERPKVLPAVLNVEPSPANQTPLPRTLPVSGGTMR
jgi:serine protease Do